MTPKRTFGQVVSRVSGTYWPFFFLALLVTVVHLSIPDLGPSEIDPKINETKKAALNLIIEVNKFLLSIAFIIIGFLGSVIVGKIQIIRSKTSNTLIFFSCLFSLISLYLGYELYDRLIMLLSNDLVEFNSSTISLLRQFEFISIIISALLFILFIYNLLTPPDNDTVEVHQMD